jgi:hypothetical protein
VLSAIRFLFVKKESLAMMKVARVLAVAITAGVSVAGISPLTASADGPSPVLILAHPCAFYPAEAGPWEASGAVNDSGIYERTAAATAPPDRPFGVSGPVRETFLFSSPQGTFMIKAEERDTGAEVTGVWELMSGTGAYADTSGHGSFAFYMTETPNTCPPPTNLFTIALTGVASKVGP